MVLNLDAFSSDDYEAIEESIAIFNAYDTEDDKKELISGNNQSV